MKRDLRDNEWEQVAGGFSGGGAEGYAGGDFFTRGNQALNAGFDRPVTVMPLEVLDYADRDYFSANRALSWIQDSQTGFTLDRAAPQARTSPPAREAQSPPRYLGSNRAAGSYRSTAPWWKSPYLNR